MANPIENQEMRGWCALRKDVVGPDGKSYVDIFCEVYDYAVQLAAEKELWIQRVTFAEAKRIAEGPQNDYGMAAHLLRDLPLTKKAELSSLAHSLHSCGTASKGDWVGLRDLWDQAFREAIKELEK